VRWPTRGGLNARDALYDSKQKLTGNHPCPILMTTSRGSRLRPRIFVPFPFSTR
jgi:hypothetical protein